MAKSIALIGHPWDIHLLLRIRGPMTPLYLGHSLIPMCPALICLAMSQGIPFPYKIPHGMLRLIEPNDIEINKNKLLSFLALGAILY